MARIARSTGEPMQRQVEAVERTGTPAQARDRRPPQRPRVHEHHAGAPKPVHSRWARVLPGSRASARRTRAHARHRVTGVEEGGGGCLEKVERMQKNWKMYWTGQTRSEATTLEFE